MTRTLTLMVVICFCGALQLEPFWKTSGQAQTLLKQARNETPQPMTAAELKLLGDPIFLLVLKDNAAATNLRQIENLIQSVPSKRKIFVVDETIANPARNQNQARRAVITFSGSTQGQILDNNLMLSVFFDEQQFPENPERIEAWGFDSGRGRFNYYVMDRSAGVHSWKFRGSSDGADGLDLAGRSGTCLACHRNGGPVMKELLRPWNNWHSVDSQATYLLSTANPSARWPVALQSPRFRERLDQAENLEGKIIAAIRQFNTKRVEAALQKNSDGTVAVDGQGLSKVLEGRRVLKPLFQTTEFNLTSSQQKSRLHPLPATSTQGPDEPVVIPNSFFLNANLIGVGGGVRGFVGLGITSAEQFSAAAKVSPQEYKELVTKTGTKLFGKPGDADFAWFVPEPSQIDNDMVDRLLRIGVVSPEFVAAVLAIDLETPVLSAERAQLLNFIPDEFNFKGANSTAPFDARRDPLTNAVIAALEASTPTANSTVARFLQLLRRMNLKNTQDPQNPRKVLESLVNAYQTRIRDTLQDAQTRKTELERLYGQALERRRAVLSNPMFREIDETEGHRGLLPLP
jgi:hypothetical protein